jgi:nitrogen fixation protein FixH
MNYKFLLIAVVLVGFIIIGASLYAGFSGRDAEVTENAYEDGLRFEERMKKERELGWKAELPRLIRASGADPVAVTILVTDRTGAALTDATVELSVNRMGSRKAKTYQCTGDLDGRYTAPIAFEETGVWEARVRVVRKGEALVLDDQISIVR